MLFKKNNFIFFLIILLLTACKTETIYIEIPQISSEQIKSLEEDDLQYWHHKDILDDSVPGISLDKAYAKLIKSKKGKTITVAIIDMEVAIDHEDLRDNLWKNIGEISGNQKDDDNNGYIDDIHGWNFLGNLKGENIFFANYEYTRIIRKLNSVFNGKTANDVSLEQQKDFFTYKRAQKAYKKRMEYALEDKRNRDLLYDSYYLAKKELSLYFSKEKYTLKKLDSLKDEFSDNEKLQKHITLLTDCLKYNFTEKYIKEYKLKADERVDKLLNLEYNEREIPGDDPEDITDIGYGNPVVNANAAFLDHGTRVAGVMAASRANNTGAKGISDHIKIMPLCISPYGDEHDKDMALAIRYAVDNGAKVINISSSKEFSLHLDWVRSALKHAAVNDVLIVTSAGNNNYDLDSPNDFNYPEDSTEDGDEFVSNFIKAGAITYKKEFRRPDSNYGKKSVDIFAPGQDIYTTSSRKDKKYEYAAGTSAAAPIVSGIAALIRAYYPKLSASEVKDIIMQSGVSYNIMIDVPGTGGKEQKPFSEFSKSGKVVNAYNALLMAARVAGEK